MRSRRLWIFLSLGVIAFVWLGWSWFGERRYRVELMEANREMANGLHQLARQRLIAITSQRTGRDEANYRLGLCEEILGHFDTAEAVLSRIPPGSAFSFQAVVARA